MRGIKDLRQILLDAMGEGSIEIEIPEKDNGVWKWLKQYQNQKEEFKYITFPPINGYMLKLCNFFRI